MLVTAEKFTSLVPSLVTSSFALIHPSSSSPINLALVRDAQAPTVAPNTSRLPVPPSLACLRRINLRPPSFSHLAHHHLDLSRTA